MAPYFYVGFREARSELLSVYSLQPRLYVNISHIEPTTCPWILPNG